MVNASDYTEVNGTHYRNGTPDGVVKVLEKARATRQRLAIVYRAESAPVYGRVSRSTGPELKVPLVVHNARSMGGEPICTTIVEEIRVAAGGALLYKAGS
jgi:hypothetical protein